MSFRLRQGYAEIYRTRNKPGSVLEVSTVSRGHGPTLAVIAMMSESSRV